MTTVLAPPSYGAAQVGLKASYTIDFSIDSTQIIPLDGMCQGDRVIPKSVHINNLNNPALITYTMQNDGGNIPAYSDGFVNIDGQSQIQFVCAQAVQITVDVLNVRVPPGFVSRGLPPNSNTAQFVAGEVLQQGDIISQGADGLAYWGADPSTYLSNFRPINLTAANNYQTTAAQILVSATISNYSQGQGKFVRCVRIGVLSYIVYADNTKKLWIFECDQLGTVTKAPVNIVTTGANTASFNLTLGTSGGLILSYNDGNNAVAKVLDTNFNVTNTVTFNTTFTAGTIRGVKAIQLSNGSVAFIANANGDKPRWAIMTLAGAVTASGQFNIATATSAANANCLDVVQQSGGNIFYAIGTGDGATMILYYAVFSIVGAVVKALTQITSGASTSAGYLVQILVLSTGNIAIICGLGSAGITGITAGYVALINGATYAIINSLSTTGGTGGIGGASVGCEISSGTIAVFTIGNSGTSNLNFYDAALTLQNTYSPGSPNGNTSDLDIVYVSVTGEVVISYSLTNTIQAARYVNGTGLVGAVTAVTGSLGTPTFSMQLNNVSSVPASAGVINYFTSDTTNNQVKEYGLGKVQRLTPMGVALGSVAQGAKVTLQTTGNVQTRLTFVQSYAVNAQAQTPPGQKMNVVGNSATLSGIQA